jgi:hypothetical protein
VLVAAAAAAAAAALEVVAFSYGWLVALSATGGRLGGEPSDLRRPEPIWATPEPGLRSSGGGGG